MDQQHSDYGLPWPGQKTRGQSALSRHLQVLAATKPIHGATETHFGRCDMIDMCWEGIEEDRGSTKCTSSLDLLSQTMKHSKDWNHQNHCMSIRSFCPFFVGMNIQYGSIWFKPLKCSKRLLQKSQLHLWAPLSLTQLQTRHVAQKNSNTWRFLGRMFPNLGTHLSVLRLNGRSFRMDREPGHIILKIARIADLFRRRVVIHRYTQEHALQIPPLGPSSGRPRSRRVVAIKPNWLSS